MPFCAYIVISFVANQPPNVKENLYHAERLLIDFFISTTQEQETGISDNLLNISIFLFWGL
ncbi:MAG TPA: hypothetical protein DIU00_23425 [Phycisphaerales bacterium]|nr:hypothetical protein [Phycisphaerales bacterium]